MRKFSFDLRLPGGSTVEVPVGTPCHRWGDAYSRACRTAEAAHGIPPYSGIVCVSYRSEPAG